MRQKCIALLDTFTEAQLAYVLTILQAMKDLIDHIQKESE